MNKRIVILACKDLSTNIIFNSLDKHIGVHSIIIEKKESFKIYLKRRIKRLGFTKVVGQILFQLFIAKPLLFFSKKRIRKILVDNLLKADEIPSKKVIGVNSINSVETINILKEINPDLIIVNGTRIISKNVLSNISCGIINMHAGITPKYRGVHGAYWALVKGDSENCGVTVHFVDKGIDTGEIISQEKIQPGRKDNFSTYPYLQLAVGIRLLNKAVDDYLNNSIKSRKKPLESHLWYHPTFGEYIYNRIFKKIK